MTSSSLVYIRVTAPKYLLSRTLEDVPCDVGNTWSEFLNHICKLEIGPNSDLLIRTASKVSKGGWHAKLEDKVQDFVKKFTYARKNYTIHLESDTVRNLVPPPNLHGLGFPKKNDFIFTTTGTGTSGIVTRQQRRASDAFAALTKKASSNDHDDPKDNRTSKQQVRPQSLKLVPVSSGPEKRKQMAVTPYAVSNRLPAMGQQCKELVVASTSSFRGNTNGGSSSNKENSNAGSGTDNEHENPTKRTKKWPEDSYRVNLGDKDAAKRGGNFPVRWSMMKDDNDDAMSTFTSVSMVERDLDRDGIDNAEIKPEVVQRLVRNFDNSAMLRIQHELRGLVTNGSWHRLTARVPRTGHLLQDIFQIYSTNSR